MKVEDLFLAAVEKQSPLERAAFLASMCGEDHQLRAQVEALLKAHEDAGSILEQPLFQSEATADQPVTECPGTTIGHYKLLEQIGEGGFGVVFMAEQTEPVRRKVALKVLKPGMDTKQVIARFEAERQALALMDHPNIAHVFDAGTTESGRPYFVMELVKGVPITEYCDDKKLETRQRLQLFDQVCQAVQHAHQKGIIHRDIKPSNVLVTPHDGVPVVKVIDFGIAKAMTGQLTDKTVFTGFAQMIGTPLYMSPEQAEINALDVDTRSDIYSLGVLLYELLTGTTPFDEETLKKAGFDEMRRIILEVEPPRPSARLSTMGHLATTRSERRNSDPRRLSQLLRGELDWIVMKCLEKDRNRRYETAIGLGLDLQRHLTGEPVLAAPPSTGYRLRKFLRKHRVPVMVAAVVLFTLIAGIAGTTWGLVEAQTERDAANQAKINETTQLKLAQASEKHAVEAAIAEKKANEQAKKRLAQLEKGNKILASIFQDLNPNSEEKEGKSLRVLLGERIGAAVQALEGEAAGDAVTVANLQSELGVSLHNLGRLDLAEEVLEKACQTLTASLGGDKTETLIAKNNLASLLLDRGKYPQSETLFLEVVEGMKVKLGADNNRTLKAKSNLALLYHAQTRFSLEEPLLLELLAIRMAKLGPNHGDTLITKNNLANLYCDQGKYSQAERLYEEVIATETLNLGPFHPRLLATKGNLGQLYQKQGKHARAEALYNEVIATGTSKLGPYHPHTLNAKNSLAGLYKVQGKYNQAEALFKETLAARMAKLGADHPDTLITKSDLASLYHGQEKLAEQERLLLEVLAMQTAKLGADHVHTLTNKHNLAALYVDQWKFAQAESLLKEVVTASTTKLGADDLFTLTGKFSLAMLYHIQAQYTQAEPLLNEVLKGRMAKLGIDDNETTKAALYLYDVGLALWDTGQLPEAEEAFRSALAFFKNRAGTLTAPSPALESTRQKQGWTNFHLALVVNAAGRPKEAIEEFHRTMEYAPGNNLYPPNFWPRIALAGILANCSDVKLRDPAKALAHARIVVEQMNHNPHAWHALGVALYRNGKWQASINALEKAIQLRKNNDVADWLFLAMAYWQRGDKDKARQWYDRAVQWMDHTGPVNRHRLAIGCTFAAMQVGPFSLLTALQWTPRPAIGENKGGDQERQFTREEATALLGLKNNEKHPPNKKQ